MHAEDSLHAITATPAGSFRNNVELRLGQLRSGLAYSEVHDIISIGLHEYLDNLQRLFSSIGDSITETFFSFQPANGVAVGSGGPASDILSGDQSQRGSGWNRGHEGDLRQ
jgi:hypothetical protein